MRERRGEKERSEGGGREGWTGKRCGTRGEEEGGEGEEGGRRGGSRGVKRIYTLHTLPHTTHILLTHSPVQSAYITERTNLCQSAVQLK